jgi:hypothetical protein
VNEEENQTEGAPLRGADSSNEADARSGKGKARRYELKETKSERLTREGIERSKALHPHISARRPALYKEEDKTK